MYIFILESIGTTELLLIGIVALIFLGPRRLPEIARKAGKIMAEFRGTANEFKETWEKEVNFEEEAKALRLDDIDQPTVPRLPATPALAEVQPEAPQVRSIDSASFETAVTEKTVENVERPDVTANDKENWL